MSIINWETEDVYECPKCKKKLILSVQDSEGYGINAFLEDGDTFESLEPIKEKKK